MRARETSATRSTFIRPQEAPKLTAWQDLPDEIDALATLGESAFVVRYLAGGPGAALAVRLGSEPVEWARDGEKVRYEMRVGVTAEAVKVLRASGIAWSKSATRLGYRVG